MNDTLPQSALREWRADISRPETLAVLAGIAAVLTFIGPFDTNEVLRFVPRLIYWAVTVSLTYTAGHFASAWTLHWLGHRLSRWPLVVATGLGIGIAVAAVVIVINMAAFGILPSGSNLPGFLASIFGITFVISAVFDVVERGRQPPVPTGAPLLDRIALEKRGRLVAISVEDHYVRIRTTKGEDMVLMRLSDAIREVGDTRGLQVHRSHWVATAAVTSATRSGDRATLTMSHGADIPVSRANVAKVKEAGLLPR